MVQYSREDVRSAITDMIVYFGRKPIPSVVELYIDSLRTYGDNAVRKAVMSFIYNGQALPKIADLRTYIEKTLGHTSKKTYDPIEDFEFPISLLQRGVNILRRHNGEEFEFLQFADRVNMPLNDRARVIQKYKAAFSAEGAVSKIGGSHPSGERRS